MILISPVHKKSKDCSENLTKTEVDIWREMNFAALLVNPAKKWLRKRFMKWSRKQIPAETGRFPCRSFWRLGLVNPWGRYRQRSDGNDFGLDDCNEFKHISYLFCKYILPIRRYTLQIQIIIKDIPQVLMSFWKFYEIQKFISRLMSYFPAFLVETG